MPRTRLSAFHVRIGIAFGVERSRDKRAAGERKLRARRERRRLGRLIAPILGRTLVQTMMPAQPFHDPVTHPLGQVADIVLRRSFTLVKAQAAAVHLLAGVNPPHGRAGRGGIRERTARPHF